MEPAEREEVLELMAPDDLNVAGRLERADTVGGVFRAKIAAFNEATGTIFVHVPQLPLDNLIEARSTVPIARTDVAKEVLIVFEEGVPRQPYIIGTVWQSQQQPPDIQPTNVKVDGEQVVIEGRKEVVLKCGKASITLTRAGKILIRGAYVLSRSSGVNRVQGGSVQIN